MVGHNRITHLTDKGEGKGAIMVTERRLETAGGGVTYEIRGAGDDFVNEVIHRIAREGVRVRGFRTETPTLEDVFLRLTGHGLRD